MVNDNGFRRPLRRGIALAAALTLTLAACGSGESSSGNGVASVDGGAGGDSGDPVSTTVVDPELVFADYEQCMKDEGIDTSFMDDGGGGNAVGEDGASGNAVVTMPTNFDIDAFEAASEVCDPILENFDPFAGMTPEQRAAVDDYMIDLQNCMEDKGFEVPDFDSSGNSVGGEDATDYTFPIDTDFEAMDAAYAECDEEIEIPEALEELEDS